MRVDRQVSKQLAQAASIVNSINGGSIFPTFRATTEKDHYRLEVSVPTILPEDMKVEVHGSNLLIYQYMRVHGYSLPNVLGSIKLSADVEVENIQASFENDLLVIILPFSELSGGFHKDIQIRWS